MHEEKTIFPAHIRLEKDGARTEKAIQSVAEHCRQTAVYAQQALQRIGLGKTAYLAGELHDCGKNKEEFKNYIEQDGKGKRGSVNHTFAGARFLLEQYHAADGVTGYEDLACELIAFAVGAHHGLFDCVNAKRTHGFQHRLEIPDQDIRYQESVQNFFSTCISREELDRLFRQSVEEITAVLEKILALCDETGSADDEGNCEFDFYLGLLARLLLSAVIEGDRRDTAEFMLSVKYPEFPQDKRELWRSCLERVETKLQQFPADTEIQRARQRISQQCRDFAAGSGGVYRLNVPTGAGKTLSALRYALAHAQLHDRSRIIFTAPLLSILDQNAQVIRDFVQDDSLILEHHSNLVQTKDQKDELDAQELMTENWSSPIIITTMVQLLHTLFLGRSGSIRRMQALCDSVIVIDEVQTVPNNLLTLFNLAVNFLSEVCHTTIILCSATQPCLEAAEHGLYRQPEDMVPYEKTLWEAFRRTSLQDAGQMQMEQIAPFAMDILEETDSLLIVCNKKEQARKLFGQLRGCAEHCFHLSADMCMAHRRQVLTRMTAAVQNSRETGEKTVCVSTQVIEAGVDISFGRVIRLLAGMDSAVQAAGRCNRNGEQAEPVPVYLVRCIDEDLKRLEEIQRAKKAAIDLLGEYEKTPDRYQNDLASDEAIRYYYHSLYAKMPEHFQDDTVNDQFSLYSLLSSNSTYCDKEYPFALNQAFQLAGSLFQVFDSDTVDVVVPYEKGKEIVKNICSERAMCDILYLQEQQERAKPYTISLYRWQVDCLEKKHGLRAACDDRVLVLQEDFYDEQTGLCLESGQQGYLEVGTECMI